MTLKPGGVVGADARMCLRVTRPIEHTVHPQFTRLSTLPPTIVVTEVTTVVTTEVMPTTVTMATGTTTVFTVATVFRAVTANSTGR